MYCQRDIYIYKRTRLYRVVKGELSYERWCFEEFTWGHWARKLLRYRDWMFVCSWETILKSTSSIHGTDKPHLMIWLKEILVSHFLSWGKRKIEILYPDVKSEYCFLVSLNSSQGSLHLVCWSSIVPHMPVHSPDLRLCCLLLFQFFFFLCVLFVKSIRNTLGN